MDAIPGWVEKWTKIGLQTGQADFKTFNHYMPICYQKAGIPYPQNIVIVNSPLVGALAASIANSIAVDGAVHGAVHAAVDDVVRAAVGGAVSAAVRVAVDGAVSADVRVAVDDAVGGAVSAAITKKWHLWLGGQFWVGGWWGSPSFVSFFTDVCGLELSAEIMQRAEAYRKVCESVNYIWPNEKFVIVCNRPIWIKRDAQGRLHAETGNAIQYPDGWGLAMWHGVRIPHEWLENKANLDPHMAITWKNIEQRRAACEIIGWAKILSALNAKVIDKNASEQIGTLLEVNLPDSGEERFLKVKCGTGRDFVIPVPRYVQTAAQANAWTYSLDQLNVEVRT